MESLTSAWEAAYSVTIALRLQAFGARAAIAEGKQEPQRGLRQPALHAFPRLFIYSPAGLPGGGSSGISPDADSSRSMSFRSSVLTRSRAETT
jgi:hypothetical protein